MSKTRLGGLVIVLILVGLCFGIFALAFSTLRFHAAYRQGMSIVKNDPAVIELLGSPIRGGLFVMGTTESYRYGGASASMETSLSGPKARGSVSILGNQAVKGGAWELIMTIRIDGQDVLRYSGSQPEKGFQTSGSQTRTDPGPAPASPTPPPGHE